MFIKKRNVVKITLLILTLIYFTITINYNMMLIDATITFVLAFLLLIKTKNNTLLFILSIFLFYCTYSIIIGEYFFKNLVGVPMQEVNNIYIYGLAIRMFLVFFMLLYLFIPKVLSDNVIQPYKKNYIIFNILYCILISIMIFGISNEQASSYMVQTTPIYEYSVILFMFLYFSTGNNNIRKMLTTLLLTLFVLQDFYFGGRITALQLIIVAMYFILSDKMKSGYILGAAIIGIIINSVVGAYRLSYSLNNISLRSILNNLAKNLFVFDTVTYSYYASATHIASINYGLATIKNRINSFVSFFISIFIGSKDILGNVTAYVDTNYFYNIGGGLFPTHFYFWFGWGGVILSGVVICLFLRKRVSNDSNYSKLSLILFVATSPRWFLYNPLTFFRTQFIFTILFVFYLFGCELTTKKV